MSTDVHGKRWKVLIATIDCVKGLELVNFDVSDLRVLGSVWFQVAQVNVDEKKE